ncbi:amidohydrolase family protein [Symmachiella dynata]|uniref:Amidohydrolase n=1 Tax=Symmachiella dynata TaxID=2527995 RepID=A0A517ZKV5_9PLAN|nr:amidohydrolase family protein [Symmachiella dynata]QDT47527.1 Amidohydrolase [Symmachiella dynata]QDU43108.1 Amidohydrolase [Symmachiella dynata]
MLNRREFSSSIATGAASLAGMLTMPGLFAAEPAPKRATKYIDVHTHIGSYTDPTKKLTVDGLLTWMDEHDIEKAVVLPLTSPESTTFLQLTDTALAAGKAHPDRLIPFCSIDPRQMVGGGVKGLVKIIQAWVDQGAKGFGEHKVGLNFDDPLMMRVYEACQEVGIPLLFHIDNIRGKDVPGLTRLEHAVSTFPELNFIGHGPGWWASISGGLDQKQLGGYPKDKVQPGGAIDRLMENYPNIYGDLSAGSGNNSIARDLEFGREFLIRRQDRIMFGTDYLAPGQAVPQFDLFTELKLPADVEQKIFKGNATRVLKLS